MSVIPADIPADVRAACLFRPDTLAWLCTRHLPNDQFKLPPHVRYIASEIVDAVRTPNAQVTIEVPVRHGKSELLSRWTPAWYLGSFPDRRVILASYEGDFAQTWGAKVRDIIDEFGHLWGIKVNPDSAARGRWDLLGRRGGMVATGTKGGITGKGAHLLLIDDPFKDSEEAMSAHIRQQKWEWLMGTALTRLEPGGVCIVLQARWHEDDFIGRIHNPEYQPPGRWRRVRLPALAEADDPLGREPGEALWPERYSRDRLEAFRTERGSYWFGALYQQAPTPIGGGIFQRANFRTFQHPTPDLYAITRDDGNSERYTRRDLSIFQTWDLSITDKTTSDYTVCATWGMTRKRDLLLLDVMRARVEGADHLAMVHAQYGKWLPAWIGIENVQYQATLVQQGIRAGLPVRALKPDKDKVTRALSAAARYEAHSIFHPADVQAPWLRDYETELLSFPSGAHDDQVDCVSYAADAIANSTMSEGWRQLLEAQAGEMDDWAA